MGETTISQEELERACRDASILEFIQSLPQGFETSVGFKGSQMSGGQRQVSGIMMYVPRCLFFFLHSGFALVCFAQSDQRKVTNGALSPLSSP